MGIEDYTISTTSLEDVFIKLNVSEQTKNMDEINDIMRKRLSIQHRGKNMIGSIAMNEIKSYLNIAKVDTEIEDEILT